MRRRSFGQSGPIAMRFVMASLAALCVAVIVLATETQEVVSPGDPNLTSTSPGALASDGGTADCGDDTHWHGSYKHEKRVVGGGGPGTIYEWYTVRPTGVEWKNTEIICL